MIKPHSNCKPAHRCSPSLPPLCVSVLGGEIGSLRPLTRIRMRISRWVRQYKKKRSTEYSNRHHLTSGGTPICDPLPKAVRREDDSLPMPSSPALSLVFDAGRNLIGTGKDFRSAKRTITNEEMGSIFRIPPTNHHQRQAVSPHDPPRISTARRNATNAAARLINFPIYSAVAAVGGLRWVRKGDYRLPATFHFQHFQVQKHSLFTSSGKFAIH